VNVPAGEFQMGDNYNDNTINDYEKPVHAVYLDQYYVSKYEITFAQYDLFCDDTARIKPGDNGWGRENRPVIQVTWNDAIDFCEWLSKKTGKNIKLLTEAQWEKAARGTDQRRYPWGNAVPDCSLVNFSGCENKTREVGSHPSGVSPYGIHDMAGNVKEWCRDRFNSGYYSVSPYENPTGPDTGDYRVHRGGAWNNLVSRLRSAARFWSSLDTKNNEIGFRICLE
jgi:formylglycine-generating enzyme required for sulfatase activity